MTVTRHIFLLAHHAVWHRAVRHTMAVMMHCWLSVGGAIGETSTVWVAGGLLILKVFLKAICIIRVVVHIFPCALSYVTHAKQIGYNLNMFLIHPHEVQELI